MMRLVDAVESSSRKSSRAGNKDAFSTKENVSPNVIPSENLLDNNKGPSTIAITSEDLFMRISYRKRGRPRKQTNPFIMDNIDISKCKGRRLEVLNNNQTLTIADLTSINLSTPIDRRDSTSFSGSALLNLQSDQGSSSIFRQNYVATDSNCTRLNLQSRIYYQGTSSSLFQDNHVATNSSNDQCEYNLRDDVMEIPTSDGYATHDTFDGFPSGYLNLGPPTEICEFCGALLWKEERNNKSQKGKKCTFSMCCKVGEIKLPPPKPTPAYLKWLIFNSNHFRHNFRAYNSIFSFTSSGGIVDH
ncbi:uncharacterized protein LOC141705226 isoform X1 [Apium graveolens]|uniref:uncharacterized protein LOC141705226 isoform X1 n=1 Tax=Apium graveolens TaxID=4045 RepID=UPI003D7AA9CC